MAEVLVVGKKISEMDLVTDIVGDEKIPTGVVGDKAVTTGQLLTYLDNNGKVQWGRIEGDITNQDDLQNQFTQQLATLQNHIQDQDNPHNVTKGQVGLGLVDNTADVDKPVSTAVQEALSLKADQTYVDDSLANKTHNSLLGRDVVGVHPASAIGYGVGSVGSFLDSLTNQERTGINAEKVFDEGGESQQEINNKVKADWVFVEDYGAKPAPFDSTSAFNDALAASSHVMTRGGVIYSINGTLNFNNAGTALFLASGTRISSSLTDTTLFALNAVNCKIYSFGGEVVSPEQYIGTQGTPTFGVVRLNANDCVVDGVRFKNYYRFCIQINNTTRHTIKRNTFNGNVPNSFYNEDNSNTLSRGAISYDNPPISTEINPYLNVSDNYFMNDVQGVLSGNFGDTGNPYGVHIVNNSFYKFYDHAMYLDGVSADYAVISNNTMIDCRRPIVAGGVGTVITGNTFKGLTQTRFFEQYISLRDPIDCIVSNNTLDGYGAGIALQGIINTKIVGNLISNNIINQTGESSFGSAMRLYESEVVDDNSITGNIIKSYPTTFVGSIFVNANTVGRNNKVVGNTIHCKSNSHAMYLRNQTGGNFSNNELVLSYDSPSDLVATILALVNVKKSNIKGNQLKCTDKGANIDLRGIQGDVDTTHNIISGNSFDFSSPSLKSRSPLIGLSQANTMRDNLLDINASMSGIFQLGTSNTVFVSNGNITTSSKVLVQPKTSAASLLLAAQGYYVIVSDGGFTFVVGGAAPTAVTEWDYVIM